MRTGSIRSVSPELGALLLLLFIGSFLTGCQRGHKAEITVAGSTSVEPFAELLAEEYMALHPRRTVYVQGGGSTAGIQATLIGATDIGMSSRPLKGEEGKLQTVVLAKDAIALIVNPANPIRNVGIEEVREIFSGRVKNWKGVGGPNHPITLVTREEGSGTREAFQKLVMGESEIDMGAIVQDSNGAVRQVVSSDPNSIGFISLGLVNEEVKALSVNGVVPVHENVVNGTYKLVRPFLFVMKDKPAGDIAAFIQFALSPHGQALLAEEGLVSVGKPEKGRVPSNG